MGYLPAMWHDFAVTVAGLAGALKFPDRGRRGRLACDRSG